MKKILFVTSKSLGGSGKYISTLGEALRQRGLHCELLYYPLGISQDIEIEAAFTKVHHFESRPGFSPTSIVANIARVRDVLKGGRFDWVHTHTSLGGFYGRVGAALSGGDIRVGHTIHAYGADEFTPVPQKWVYWMIERALDAVTDAYVSPSRYMVAYGARTRLITSWKATVIHNSLRLQPPPADSASLRMAKRAELGVADDQILFLFCGRLERQKGVDVLLDAFAKLPTEFSVHLIICGIGDDADILRARARTLGIDANITWAGWQSALESYYASADVYVMPSRWESFGLVFLEAMNYSLPVASTTAQAIPEVVSDGISGLLSPSEDIFALRDNLLALATDPELRRRMGEAGKHRLDACFSFERFVDDHVRWYESDHIGNSITS